MVTPLLALGDSCCNRSNSYNKNNNGVKHRVFNTNNDNSSQIDIKKRKRNTTNCETKNQNCLSTFRLILMLFLSLLAMIDAVVAVQSAAVYSNINFLTNPNFEQICSVQQEHYIESDGKESSLIMEFAPGVLAEKRKLCTRILSAPTNYGFIIRLILPKIRRNRHGALAPSGTNVEGGAVGLATSTVGTSPMTTTSAAAVTALSDRVDGDAGAAKRSGVPALSGMAALIEQLNATTSKAVKPARSCPLKIFSSLDFHTPQWRLDPCQLEDTAPDMEDPVRLFHGRVRIVWEHSHHTLYSKLMVTALGKGEQCRSEKKHQCLRIGDEPILCISKELVCDGIRHCPISNEYDSDEDYEMCWKRRRFGEPIPPAMETDIFEHFALEVFRNLFAFDVPTYGEKTTAPTSTTADATFAQEGGGKGGVVNSTTLLKVGSKQMGVTTNDTNRGGSGTDEPKTEAEHATESPGGHHRRNSTRSGMHSDLSKYGPWGYLMLGMLLCGGALLICGLWASASQHATNNERESALQSGAASAGSDLQSGSVSPPNYEELDPPPAYSVLFPNQKAASSTTLSSLGAAALMPPTMAAVAVTTPNGTAATSPTGGPASSAALATPPTTTATAATSSAAATAASTARLQLESAACSSQAQ